MLGTWMDEVLENKRTMKKQSEPPTFILSSRKQIQNKITLLF